MSVRSLVHSKVCKEYIVEAGYAPNNNIKYFAHNIPNFDILKVRGVKVIWTDGIYLEDGNIFTYSPITSVGRMVLTATNVIIQTNSDLSTYKVTVFIEYDEQS